MNSGTSQHCSLELTAILPCTIADHGYPYWALWGVPSLPILSTLSSLPTMPLFHRYSPCPGASIGQSWCHAAIDGAVSQIRYRAVIFLSPGGLPRVESEMWWSSSFTSSAFSRKWSTVGPGSPFVFVCVYVGESTGSIQPLKVTCRRGSGHSLLSTPKLCWLTTQFRCLWRFLFEGWKFASVLPVQVLSQIWTKSL